MNILTYKDYQATIAYDEDSGLLHGEAADLRDVITFQSKAKAALPNAFAVSVEDYLRFCKERGEAPQRPSKKKAASA